MRKKINKLVVLTIVLTIILGGFETFAQKAPQNEENSLLWEISGNGLENPSYLFGTIHLIPKEDYFFTDKMEEKLNSCKTLVLETSPNIPLKKQIEILKKMLLPKGRPLNSYMTEEQFTQYRSVMLDSLKLKKSKFNKTLNLKPIVSSAVILRFLLDEVISYEMVLSKKAKKQKMDFKQLEDVDFQVDLLNSLSIEEQVEMMFDNNSSLNPLEDYNLILEEYKQGNLTKIHELVSSDPSMKKLEEQLLTNRNADWIPKIENIIKEKPAFIAVGAAHLPGDEGVIKLLQKKGYTVKAVK